MPNKARTGIMIASMMKEESSFKAFSSASPIFSDLVFVRSIPGAVSNLWKCSQQIQWGPNCFDASSSSSFLPQCGVMFIRKPI